MVGVYHYGGVVVSVQVGSLPVVVILLNGDCCWVQDGSRD